MRTEVRRSTWYLPIGGVVMLFSFGVHYVVEWGWITAAGFASLGLVIMGLFNRMARNDPVITLDDDGIWDERWGFDRAVPWHHVRSAQECGIGEIRLGLEVPLEAKPANSGDLLKTKESLSRLETHAWGLQVSRQELLRLIREYVDEVRLQ